MSISTWMGKEIVVHIHNGTLLTHKTEWNHAICSNRDGPRDDHTKWTKSERQRPYAVTCMWNLKYDTNDLWNRNRSTNAENRLVTAQEEGTSIYVWLSNLGKAFLAGLHCGREMTCGFQTGEGWIESLGLADYILRLYRVDKEQGPTVHNRALYSVSCDKPQ